MKTDITDISRAELLDLKLQHDDWHVEELAGRTYLVR